MWEKFTSSSKRIIKYAHEEAKYYHSDVVDTEHLLLGLLKDESSFGVKILQKMNVDCDKLRADIIKEITPRGYEFENLNFSKISKSVLEKAYYITRDLRHTFIGSEHMLLALLDVKEGKAYEILTRYAITYEIALVVLSEMWEMMSGSPLNVKTAMPVEKPETPRQRNINEPSDYSHLFSKLNPDSLQVVIRAHEEAKKSASGILRQEHLLISLIADENLITFKILTDMGVDIEKVRSELIQEISTDINVEDKLAFVNKSKLVLELANAEALKRGLDEIHPEHLLLGLLQSLYPGSCEVPDSHQILYAKVEKIIDENSPQRYQATGAVPFGPDKPEEHGRLFDKFTSALKRVIKYAHEEAVHFRNDVVDTEHLLLGLLNEKNSFAANALQQMGVNTEKLRSAVIQYIPIGSYDLMNLNFSKQSKEVLEQAYKEARQLRHTFIGSEHLLLGMLKVSDSKACQILKKHNVSYQIAKKTIISMVCSPPSSAPNSIIDKLHDISHEFPILNSTLRQILAGPGKGEIKSPDDILRPEHLLLALLRNGNSHAVKALVKMSINIDQCRTEVINEITGSGSVQIFPDYIGYLRQVLTFAKEEARKKRYPVITSGHLLLGLLRVADSKAAEILNRHGITYHPTRKIIAEMRDEGEI